MSPERRLRVLVTLDPAISSEAALEAVRSLAAGRQTALQGLFVEDVNLRRLADLPFARQVTHATGSLESMDPGRLESQLRAQAERLRRHFEQTAAKLQLRCSFRVEQGEVGEEVSRAARQADVLVVCHASRTTTWQGPAAHRLAVEQETTVVVLRGAWRTGTSVLVLFDDSPGAGAALDTASRIAEQENLELTLLLPEATGGGPERLEERARELLSGLEGRVRCVRLPSSEPLELIRASSSEAARALVLPAALAGFDEEGARLLLEHLRCALILAR